MQEPKHVPTLPRTAPPRPPRCTTHRRDDTLYPCCRNPSTGTRSLGTTSNALRASFRAVRVQRGAAPAQRFGPRRCRRRPRFPDACATQRFGGLQCVHKAANGRSGGESRRDARLFAQRNLLAEAEREREAAVPPVHTPSRATRVVALRVAGPQRRTATRGCGLSRPPSSTQGRDNGTLPRRAEKLETSSRRRGPS